MKSLIPQILVSAVFVATLSSHCAQALSIYSFGSGTYAADASSDGSWVVGRNASQRAFLWNATSGMLDLGVLGGATESVATGVSDDGTVVVGSSGDRAFRWTVSSGMVDLGTLAGRSVSFASGVSADGAIVAGTSYTPGEPDTSAFRWTLDGGMQSLGTLPGAPTSSTYGISADGSSVVGVSGNRAFIWTESVGMTKIGSLDGENWAQARGVNSDGSVVVGLSLTTSGPQRAFSWSEDAGIVNLGVLQGDQWSSAYSVSGDGSMIVGAGGSSGTDRAYVWTANRDLFSLDSYLANMGLDISAWEFLRADSISAAGNTIVGTGNYLGEQGAFIVVGVPEPSTYALLAMSAAGALWWARRRR